MQLDINVANRTETLIRKFDQRKFQNGKIPSPNDHQVLVMVSSTV